MKAFFDSNIFLYHLTGNYSLASDYIEKVEMGIIQGYINDIVYSEVILGFLRAQTQLSSKRIREKLPYLSIDSDDLQDLLSIFINLPSHSGSYLRWVGTDHSLSHHL